MKKDDFTKISARVLKRRKEQRQKERQWEEEEKHKQKNWKKIQWEEQPTELFEYALWYYHKRFQLLNISMIFAIPGLILLLFVANYENFFFLAGFFIGLARAIATPGRAWEGGGMLNRWLSYYDKSNLFEVGWFSGVRECDSSEKRGGGQQLTKRFCAFVIGFLVPPLSLFVHLIDYIGVLIRRNDPPPPKPTPEPL